MTKTYTAPVVIANGDAVRATMAPPSGVGEGSDKLPIAGGVGFNL